MLCAYTTRVYITCVYVCIYMHVVYTCIADVHVDGRYIDVYRYVDMVDMYLCTYVICVYIMYTCVWHMTHVYMPCIYVYTCVCAYVCILDPCVTYMLCMHVHV